jgi:hypothetical protein
MPHKPIEPMPDTVRPETVPEAPRIDCPEEHPGNCPPDFVCPPDPSYTPDQAPPERPSPDPDD